MKLTPSELEVLKIIIEQPSEELPDIMDRRIGMVEDMNNLAMKGVLRVKWVDDKRVYYISGDYE